MTTLDLLLVNAPSRLHAYQQLASVAAIEPPVWAGLIAQHCLNQGFSVQILDAEAEGLTVQQTAECINELNPRLAAFCIYGQQPSASTQCMPAAIQCAKLSKVHTLALGTHPAALPLETLHEGGFDYACTGEGPIAIDELLTSSESARGMVEVTYRDGDFITCNQNPPAPLISDLDHELPGQAWHLLNMTKYRAHNWHLWTRRKDSVSGIEDGGYASVQTSLGCPYKCLAGDTLVNTIEGELPIAELAKTKRVIPVYTYKDGRVLIADAINIMKLGTDQKLVRVKFTDGTHIDCTPDHRFLTYQINTPRNGAIKEIPAEAKDLKSGDRIRAMAVRQGKNGRKRIEWKRTGEYNSILVKEYALGRKLRAEEEVHHRDHDPSNDVPDNLVLCKNHLDHVHNHHPEIAERMRTKNPMRNKITARKVQRVLKIKYRNEPFVRSAQGTENIRAAARKRMLVNNPMKDPNVVSNPKLRRKRSKRMKALWAQGKATALRLLGRREVNHRVESVTWLTGKHDVYCLEVPGYGWFFANNVLVKNCSFCCINAPFGGPSYRRWSPGNVVTQISTLYNRYGITNIKIPDEMFVLNCQHVTEICNGLLERGLGERLNMWCYARVDTIKDDALLVLMQRAGFRWIGIGIESGSKHVRDGVVKGRFGNDEIIRVCERVRQHGLNVGANFIIGLPDDDEASIDATFELACEINPEWMNVYSAMAYPGSRLHAIAREKGWRLPEDPGGPGWIGYAQHAYECLPLPTEKLTAADVLWSRDEFFMRFYRRPAHLSMVEKKFGHDANASVHTMLALGKPKRQILGD